MTAPIVIKHKGDFKKTRKFMDRVLRRDYLTILKRYGDNGVDILRSVTPVDSGVTADSWSYSIEEGDGTISVVWKNSSENNNVNIAILLIYGHGLQNGGYVQGHNFVTPAMRPLLKELADKMWRGVTK